jgi:hypothetical protein
VRLCLAHQAPGGQDGALGGLEEPGLQLIGTRPEARWRAPGRVPISRFWFRVDSDLNTKNWKRQAHY